MKDSFYFQHDYNSASDQKILKIRAKFNNAEGYGIYFMILEAMAQEENGILDNDCIAQLSLSYGLAIKQLELFLNYCIEIGLFTQDERGIFSKRMIEHKNYRKERSNAGKRGAKTRWADSSAIKEPLAQPMQRKGKERKEKEIYKEINKEKINIYSITENQLQEIADKFKVPIAFVKSKYEDMIDWHKSTGKIRKDWVATLRNFVKSDAIKRIDHAKQSGNKTALDFTGI